MESATPIHLPKNQAAVTKSIARWVGAALLFLVGYIHLALVVNMFGFSNRLGVLFFLNAIGAFVAMIGVLLRSRWIGWVFGIVMAGGAAISKILFNAIPGFGAVLTGMHMGARKPPGPNGANGGGGAWGQSGSGTKMTGMGHTGGPPGGHGNFGAMHSILPTFTNTGTLGTLSIVIELLFVVLAIYALIARMTRKDIA